MAGEAYWTYKAPHTPTYAELPAGVFRGTEKQWYGLSPGMRREIVRGAKHAFAWPWLPANANLTNSRQSA